MTTDKKPYLRLMLALAGAAVLGILFFFLLFRLDRVKEAVRTIIEVLMPFIIGGVLAYVLTPVCNFFETRLKEKLPERKNKDRIAGGLSILLTLVLAFFVVFVLLILVVPSLIDSIYSVLRQIPGSLEEFEEWAVALVGDNETLSNYITELTETISEEFPDWVNDTVLPGLQTLVGTVSAKVVSLIGVFYNLLIGIIVSVYLLGSRKIFVRQGKKLIYSIFSRKWADVIVKELRFANRMFSGFISGRLVDSLIIGIICFVGMLILKLPYPILVSVIVGVTNIIPFFGPYIGAIPSFLLILMVNPMKAVIFLIFILILQQFDGNILGPRILGNVTGLSSFWVLFAILIFGGLFGFIGMIIGVPVFAVIYDIVRKLVNRGLARHNVQAGKL